MASSRDFSWVWQGLISNVIWVPLAAAGAFAVGYLKKHESLYTAPVLYGLGAFCLVLASGAFLRWTTTVNLRLRKTVTPRNARKVIRDWLDQAGLEVRNVELEGLRFHYIVTVNERKISVAQSEAKPHLINFNSTVNFTDEDNRVLSRAPGGVPAVLKNLRIHLAAYKIGYSGIGAPLRQVSLFRNILITSDFNEYQFMRGLDEVELAFALMQAVVDVGDSPPPSPATIGPISS